VQARRIENHPLLPAGEPGEVVIFFEGRPLVARRGESIAAALTAAGVEIFGRSFKYHRPRGLHCGRGHCPSCMMRVDGLPGVRTCVTEVREGQQIEREHAWPSADADALQVIDRLSRFTPAGFYYRRFTRSRSLFERWERVLAHLAGRGEIADAGAAEALAAAAAPPRRSAVDLVVVGGGPAGIAAAVSAAEEGARVVLLHAGAALGGRLRADTDAASPVAELQVPGWGESLPGFRAAELLASWLSSVPGARVLTSTAALGLFDDGCLVAQGPAGVEVLEASRFVFATGLIDRPLIFTNSDLPGVLLAHGMQRMLHEMRVRPGRRAVVVTDNVFGHRLARQMAVAGFDLVAVVDERTERGVVRRDSAARPPGTRVLAGHTVARVTGSRRVEKVFLRPVEATGEPPFWAQIAFSCDTVCVAMGGLPFDELYSVYLAEPPGPGALGRGQGKATPEGVEGAAGAVALGELLPGIESWAAGAVAGATGLEQALLGGRRAALSSVEG
jgi:sarcosine oxidase, subunit alpha